MFENLNFNDLSTGGVAMVIIAGFCVIGFVKGLVKMVFSLAALGLACFAAYWGYQNGHNIAANVVEKPEPWMAVAVSAIAGIGVFSIGKSVFGFLTNGFNQTGTAKRIGFGPPAGLMGLLMGLGLVYAGLSAVRYIGSVAELHRIDTAITRKTADAPARPLFIRLKEKIDASKPGQFHRKFDFLNDSARTQVAKLMVVRQDRVAFARVLQDQAGSLSTLTLPDQKVTKLIEEKNFPALLRETKLDSLTSDPALAEALNNLKIESRLGLEE